MKAKPKNFGRCLNGGVGICLGAGLLLLQCFTASAQVIYTYGGGISGTSQFTDEGNDQESLTFTGTQTGPGSLGVTVYNGPTDPTLMLSESINNQSSFSWGQYNVSVVMGQPFSIGSVTVTAPPGWSDTIIQPVGPDINGNYTGMVDYFVTGGGTPVAPSPSPNDILNFGYAVTFNSATSFSLTESAMVTAVPEPGTANVLLVAGLLFGGRMFFKRRRAKAGATN